MPQFITMYAQPLEDQVDMGDVCQAIWDAANESGLFVPEAIKVRAVPVDHYVVGTEGRAPFLHIDAKMYAGRTIEQKQKLLASVLERVGPLVGEAPALSIEAIDIIKEAYLKRG